MLCQHYSGCSEFQVAATKAALTLLETQDFEIDEMIYEDRDEWSMWRGRGDQVLHIGTGCRWYLRE